MAREGARIAIVYLEEHKDANATRDLVAREGSQAILLAGDVGDEAFCEAAVEATVEQFGRLDILVNNAAEQHETDDVRTIDAAQIERTFRTNIYSVFFMIKHALRHMPRGGAIINTASVTAYQGHKTLIDYSATKGAIVTLTRSLSEALAKDGIRVNAVAPGPIWTPLIPASFDAGTRRQARLERADAAPGPAERGRALLRVPGQRGRLLYQRPGAASERRRRGRLLTAEPSARRSRYVPTS